MTAEAQFFGHGYTLKRRSRYGNTPHRRCKPTLDGDDTQINFFGFTVTSDTVGTGVKSVSSKRGTNVPQSNGVDIDIISTRYDGNDEYLIHTRHTEIQRRK